MQIMGYEVKKDTLVQPVPELKEKLSTPKSQSSTLSELVFSRPSYLPPDATAADLHAASTPSETHLQRRIADNYEQAL